MLSLDEAAQLGAIVACVLHKVLKVGEGGTL